MRMVWLLRWWLQLTVCVLVLPCSALTAGTLPNVLQVPATCMAACAMHARCALHASMHSMTPACCTLHRRRRLSSVFKWLVRLEFEVSERILFSAG